MLFNTSTTGDPRSFFYYNGDYYINGTEIVLKDDYINNHQWNGKKLWKYARYDHKTIYNGRIAYFFCRSRADWLSLNEMGLDARVTNEYAPYFVVEALFIDSLIEDISKPIKLQREETEAIMNAIVQPKSDFDNTGLMVLWIVYISVMIGSLIFNQFYIIWMVASFVFFKLRKEMLNG
jgi:hypothetical protein